MNRHVLIGRFGSDDKATIPVADTEIATELQFVQATKRLDLRRCREGGHSVLMFRQLLAALELKTAEDE